jgi:hypothetical protein
MLAVWSSSRVLDWRMMRWSDAEIAEQITGAKTAEDAIKRMRNIVSAQDSYRKEIAATAW